MSALPSPLFIPLIHIRLAKDLPSQEAYPTRPTPLHLDFEVASDVEDTTPLLSPQGTPSQSRPRSMTQASPAPPTLQGRHRSATVANPPKSAPPGGAPQEREKRKRSRVTPEQLAHLERLFALDRSPTAAKRKEISEMLGMQERQTQIWFQNRYFHPLPSILSPSSHPPPHQTSESKNPRRKGKTWLSRFPPFGRRQPSRYTI